MAKDMAELGTEGTQVSPCTHDPSINKHINYVFSGV